MSQHQSVNPSLFVACNNPTATFVWDDGAWIFAPDEWEQLRPRGAEQRAAWIANWEETVFDLADERARVHLELQTFLANAELQRRLALVQRADCDESAPSCLAPLDWLCEATLSPTRWARWRELAQRLARLDAFLVAARTKRLWLEEHPPASAPLVSVRATALFEARITLGLRAGFQGSIATIDEVRDFLGEWLAAQPFTVSISLLDLVYAAGSEPGVCLCLLDDPRFPVGKDGLRERALALGRALLPRFQQQRLGVLCGGEFILLEEEAKTP